MTIRTFVTALVLMTAWQARAQTAPATAAPVNTAPAAANGTKAGPAALPPPLPHPTTEAQLRQFLELTDVPTRVHKDLNLGVANMRSRAPQYIPASVWGEIETDLQGLDLVHIYLPIYQAYLSEQDMNSMLTFYRSDAGKHFVAVQAPLFTAAQGALAAQVQAAFQSVFAKHKDEIEAAKQKAEGPAAPPSSPK